MDGLSILNNISAKNTHRNLGITGKKLDTSSARLSSGYRINSAKDDAAGIAISEKMRAQIRGLDKAIENAENGGLMLQTAEGGLQEIDNMLHRIRELTVQAANDTNDFTTADREKLQQEINQLTHAIDSMAGSVEYNAQKLLDGRLMGSEAKGSALADLQVKMMKKLGQGATGLTAYSSVSDIASMINSGGQIGGGCIPKPEGELGLMYAMANYTYTNSATRLHAVVVDYIEYSTLTSESVHPGSASFPSGEKATSTWAASSVSTWGCTGQIAGTRCYTECTSAGSHNTFETCNTNTHSTYSIPSTTRYDTSSHSVSTSVYTNTASRESWYIHTPTHSMQCTDGTTFAAGMGTTGDTWTVNGTYAVNDPTECCSRSCEYNAYTGSASTHSCYTTSDKPITASRRTSSYYTSTTTLPIISYTACGPTTHTAAPCTAPAYGSFSQYATTRSDYFETYPAFSGDPSELHTWNIPTYYQCSSLNGETCNIVFMDGCKYFQPNFYYCVTTQVNGRNSYTQCLANLHLTGCVNGLTTVCCLGMVKTSDVSDGQALMDYVRALDEYLLQVRDASWNAIEVSPPFPTLDKMVDNIIFQKETAMRLYADLVLLSAESRSYESINNVEGDGLYFQTGANSMQGVEVGIGKATTDILGIGTGDGNSTISVDSSDALEISAQINVLDHALLYVTGQRAKLGALQNRLNHSVNSLGVTSNNLSESESRIRDADMAKEMMANTTANILNQSGIALMTQANQQPQRVLQLLQQ
ncbi:MAG: hypothetical protein LBR83_04890 [Clostridiales bacterium]|jgi:flagellin-like hook-associated protein FlgL|nr:hypothetical protein [Clostridiales bacterium]